MSTNQVAGRDMRVDVAVVILTYNEEANIAQALRSVCGWAREVFLFDSGSSDGTAEIARAFDCCVITHPFTNYAQQRNDSLRRLPITAAWTLFLDADEWLPEPLKDEIGATIAARPEENGFYLNRRLLWMGSWIRRGYYPTWILRLFRTGTGRCEERTVNEHIVVEGKTGRLKNDFLHEDRRGLTHWIAKHNDYATREAEELFVDQESASYLPARFFGTQPERKRWLRARVYQRVPPLARPFTFFFYRFIVKGGFLDGRTAFLYHFLQAFWFPLLIYAKQQEMAKDAAPAREAKPARVHP